ncbi:MAG: hypothetical protein ABIJ92_04475 [Candidatus Aenigmatarchaeota archaeon]
MEPIICFGQQPNGIFPKNFFVAKIDSARKLQREIGGKIIWFCHDSDHDHRETKTRIESNMHKEGFVDLNFSIKNKTQRKYTPLYLKEITPEWKEETRKILERIVSLELLIIFYSVNETRVADFCIEMYKRMGLLDGIDIVRSSDPRFREEAEKPEEEFIDVEYDGEIVRARCMKDGLYLHEGGDSYKKMADMCDYSKKQVSAARDSRFPWMQSVIKATHYVYGMSEKEYIKKQQIEMVPRDEIDKKDFAFIQLLK